MPYTILTRRLSELHAASALSTDKLLEIPNITRAAWSKILSGSSIPTDETIKNLASALVGVRGATANELFELTWLVRDPPLRIAFPMAGWPAMLIGMMANKANAFGRSDRAPYDLTCFGWRDSQGGYWPQFWNPYIKRKSWPWPGQLRSPAENRPPVCYFSAQECLDMLKPREGEDSAQVDAAIVASGTYGAREDLMRIATIQHSIGNAYLAVIGPELDLPDSGSFIPIDQVLVPHMTNATMLKPFLFRNRLSSLANSSAETDEGPFRDSALDGWSNEFHSGWKGKFSKRKQHTIENAQFISSVFEQSDSRVAVEEVLPDQHTGPRRADDSRFKGTGHRFQVPRRIRFVTTSDIVTPLNIGDYAAVESKIVEQATRSTLGVVLWTPQSSWLAQAVDSHNSRSASERDKLVYRTYRPPYFAMVRGDESTSSSPDELAPRPADDQPSTWMRFDLVIPLAEAQRWKHSSALDAFCDDLTEYATQASKANNRVRTCTEIAHFLDVKDHAGALLDGPASIASILANQRLDITMSRQWFNRKE